jgi:hypothetical protein
MIHDERAVLIPIDSITFWKQNPNKHSPRQLDAIRASMRKFGFVNSVTIAKIMDEGGVLELRAGEGRTRALMRELSEDPTFVPKNLEGHPGHVPAVIHEFATRADADAYGIVDETIGDMSDFDDMLAADLLRELGLEDQSVEELGLADLMDLDLDDLDNDWGNKGEHTNKRTPVIEIAVRVPDDVTTIERALALAARQHPSVLRGQLLTLICESYLGGAGGKA